MMIAFLVLSAALFTAFMVVYIDNDGHGRMPEVKHPLRSHHADGFEPRSLG